MSGKRKNRSDDHNTLLVAVDPQARGGTVSKLRHIHDDDTTLDFLRRENGVSQVLNPAPQNRVNVMPSNGLITGTLRSGLIANTSQAATGASSGGDAHGRNRQLSRDGSHLPRARRIGPQPQWTLAGTCRSMARTQAGGTG
jgi:hypothetical protein